MIREKKPEKQEQPSNNNQHTMKTNKYPHLMNLKLIMLIYHILAF